MLILRTHLKFRCKEKPNRDVNLNILWQASVREQQGPGDLVMPVASPAVDCIEPQHILGAKTELLDKMMIADQIYHAT